MSISIKHIRLAACAVLLQPVGWLLAEFGNPSGFLADEQMEEALLEGGLLWRQVSGTHEGVPQVLHTVTIDLSHTHLNLKLLRGERFVSPPKQYHRRSTVSQLQKDNGVAVAINTSFFDISATQTPFGLLIDERMLLRTPASKRAVLVLTDDKELVIGNFSATVLCSYGGAAPVVNSVNGNSIPDNSLHLYRQPWDRSPGNSAAFVNGLPLAEVVLEIGQLTPAQSAFGITSLKCEVKEIRDGMDSVQIGPDEAVLSGTGTMREFLLKMQPGEEFNILWRVTGGGYGFSGHKIRTAVAGSALLLVDGIAGRANNDHWNRRHPRSAVGVAQDGRQMVLVLVEGRMEGRAEGMSLHTLAQLLLHMEAFDGLEFDGGGSSALAGRPAGEDRLLSMPSGGSERYVPAGLGILRTDSSSYPLFHDVKATASDREAVVTWTTPFPAASYLAMDASPGREPLSPVTPVGADHSAQFIMDAEAPSGNRIRLLAVTDDGVVESPPIKVRRGQPDAGSVPPAWWVAHYHGEGSPGPESDADDDGYSLLEEYAWGTDPTRFASAPRFTLQLNDGGSGALRFSPYIAGKPYRLLTMELSGSGFSEAATSPEPDSLGNAHFSFESGLSGTLHRVEVLDIP